MQPAMIAARLCVMRLNMSHSNSAAKPNSTTPFATTIAIKREILREPRHDDVSYGQDERQETGHR
jgi:hypothetical protein